jgi:fluoroquinolone transport system permease protein
MTAARFAHTLKTDVTVQLRNRLYAIGIAVALFIGLLTALLTPPESFAQSLPVLLLFVVGGSTLLYVGGMFLFEKNEGTLNALIVSPLRTREYLWSKVVTLSVLASLEGMVILGTAFVLPATGLLDHSEGSLPAISVPLLGVGLLSVASVYTLIGVVTVVRYAQVTDFLVPVLSIALVLQIPAVEVGGLMDSYVLYVIPTMAPTLIIAGAFESLAVWQWTYAFGYTLLMNVLLYVWARAAFQRYVVQGG